MKLLKHQTQNRWKPTCAALSTVALMAGALPATDTMIAPAMALADTHAASAATTEMTYNLAIPGSILVYKNEVSQGGLNLVNGQMTNQAANTDIAFDNGGGTIGARGILDLGTVSFDSVNTLPDYAYDAEDHAVQGHVYLVQTHDNRIAKVLIEAVLNGNVSLKVAYLNAQASTSGGMTDNTTSTNKPTSTGKSTSNQKPSQPPKPPSNSNPKVPSKPASINISMFLNHTWKLIVPSSSYSTTDTATDTTTTTSSVGSLAGTLRLNSNGTYVWFDPIDGNIKGHWVRESDSGYPIVLLKGANGTDWKLGKSSPKTGGGSILIWDGTLWEIGFK